jgi:predicted ABC-class ATPase
MSRHGYLEDYDAEDVRYTNLYRGRVASAIRGKRGQAFFGELIASLDAMPEKRLIDEVLEEDGEVCALGALVRFKGLDNSAFGSYLLDSDAHSQLASALNVASCLIAEVEFENDDGDGWCLSPEERWNHMRKWAEKQVKQEVAP